MSTINLDNMSVPINFRSAREEEYRRYFGAQSVRRTDVADDFNLEQPWPFAITHGLGSDGMDSTPIANHTGESDCPTGTTY